MECFLLILEFSGGLIIVFGVGKTIGHFLRLNKVMENQQNKNNLKL